MFRQERVPVLRVLAALVAASSLAAAVAGIAVPDMYRHVTDGATVPFCVGQDVVTVVAALLLAALAARGARTPAGDVLEVGVVGYLFYACGPNAMGLLYTPCYLLYLTAFGGSIYYLACALTAVRYDRLEFTMPKGLRVAITVYCGSMTPLWAPQWIIGVMQQIQHGARPGDFGMYWIYVLDLCVVLPATAVTAVLLARRRALGYVLGGAIMVKGFVLMLSVAMGNYLQPAFGERMVVGGAGGAALFTVLWPLFLALTVAFFARTTIRPRGDLAGMA